MLMVVVLKDEPIGSYLSLGITPYSSYIKKFKKVFSNGFSMEHKDKYLKSKERLFKDKSICNDNKELFKKTLEYLEKKLRRKNNLEVLDEGCYKTLYHYVNKFENVNQWFKNKPIDELNEKQIKEVLVNFQDNKIKKKNGQPYQDKKSYYSKIFKGKLFEFAGKKEIVRKIMEEEFFSSNKQEEVRFIESKDVEQIIKTAIQFEHKCFLQLYWDIGENPFSLLQLQKKDCRKILDDKKQPKYNIHLRKEILKRSRTPRVTTTMYNETCEFLDELLEDKEDNDLLFNFGVRQCEKFFSRAVEKLKIKTIPGGDRPKLKDIRSSMACHLLKLKVPQPQINGRLGHRPSSPVIDRYINYLNLNKDNTNEIVFESSLKELQEKIKTLEVQNETKEQSIQSLNKTILLIANKVNELQCKVEDKPRPIKPKYRLVNVKTFSDKQKEVEPIVF